MRNNVPAAAELSLPEPKFRILRSLLLPYLEMKLRVPVYGIDHSYDIPRPDLVPCLYRSALQLAVEREPVAVLDQDTLVIARHHDNLLDYPVENCPDLRALVHGDGNAVVERQLDTREHRMVMLPEAVHHNPVCRPWQLSLVPGEFRVQGIIYLCRLPGILPPFS